MFESALLLAQISGEIFMTSSIDPIVVLASSVNEQGDLFTELVSSYFNTVGYEDCRFNIHKSGRELDVSGEHRTEQRVLIAECKATGGKIGGGAINKFVGVLDAEKRKNTKQTAGYFLSLSGFTETALQQEEDLENERVVLADGHEIVDELISGKIIATKEEATLAAGRVAGPNRNLQLEPSLQLYAHHIGFVWSVFFSENKKTTHVALIHADGVPLHPDVAAPILNHPLFPRELTYLAPPNLEMPSSEYLEAAERSYFSYLEAECGDIQLDGLPADQEVGARRLRLESIFVPSHLRSLDGETYQASDDSDEELELFEDEEESEGRDLSEREINKDRIPAGQILSFSKRIAILGLPGSGKSTLLKRLSTAYAFPTRMTLVNDSLPQELHFPIFIRCRQLRDRAREPILELLNDITKRAEMSSDIGDAFSFLIQRSMRSGRALLLVDGLDEISDSSDRVAFVSQLRTFLHRYPNVGLIITSRQAGFRAVGSALSTVCSHYTLTDFDDGDIKRLTLAWHKEVIGDKPDIAADAVELGNKICSIPRVRQLAGNPLLLTTLLLVKRWVGSLPTKRSILYAKAIEVLLATWNVEGHAPLDQEEVVPQLEYLAFSMMRDGIQQIGLENLKNILIEAREEMPEILSYTKVSPSELVDRIELRSSLLMQSGTDVIDGKLMPVYEFRHLTFQEFLCAQAIVTGHYPGAHEDDSPLSILQPHFEHENWQEVILLAMVLLGRRVAPLVRHLMYLIDQDITDERWHSDLKVSKPPGRLLQDALIDEIQITPDLFEDAFRKVLSSHSAESILSEGLYRTKYRDAAFLIAKNVFFSKEHGKDFIRAGSLIAVFTALNESFSLARPSAFTKELSNNLKQRIESSSTTEELATALLLTMELAYAAHTNQIPRSTRLDQVSTHQHIKDLAHTVCTYLTDTRIQIAVASVWAFNWLSRLPTDIVDDPLSLFKQFWISSRQEDNEDLKYLHQWAMNCFGIFPKDSFPLGQATEEIQREVVKDLTEEKSMYGRAKRRAALITAYYLELLSPKELAGFISEENSSFERHLNEINLAIKEG